MRVGLVFSGGGAKGAYQAGVVRAFANHKLEATMISGASIGALNGAIVSASVDMATAADRLAAVWDLVANDNVLKFNAENYPRYLAMLAAVGLTGIGSLGLGLMAGLAGSQTDTGYMDTGPLTEALDRYLTHFTNDGRNMAL